MGKLIFAASLLVLVACQHSGGSFCDVSKPIRLSPATVDAMTDAEVQRALEHNALGQRLCGWKP